MKNLRSATTFVALMNLAAIAGLVGWLALTGRLSRGRLDAVRAIFAQTVQAEAAAGEAAAADHRESLFDAIEREREEHPFPPSVEHVTRLLSIEEQTNELRRRARSEIDVIADNLETAQERLAAEREAFAAEKAEWQRAQAALLEQRNNEQFRHVVDLLAQMPPKQARDILMAWAAADGPEDAASYLAALDPRTASKVLREFKTDEEKQLAGELLKQIEALGLEIDAAADAADNAPANPG
jgi:flagellar motility protein MotE (MotC chaperone)